jgi:hypothetical protein
LPVPSDTPTQSEPPPEPTPPAEQSKPPAKKGKSAPARKSKTDKTWFPTITKNRIFAGLLFFVAALTVAALLIRVVLAFAAKEPPTQMQVELARICEYIITAGFSSLIGLLAGRAAAPDQLEVGDKK